VVPPSCGARRAAPGPFGHDHAEGLWRAARIFSTALSDRRTGAGRWPRVRLSRCTTTSSVPYLLHYGTEEQKKKWIPRLLGRAGDGHRHDRAGAPARTCVGQTRR